MGSVVRGATVVKKWQRNVSAPTCSFESRVRWCPTRAQFRRDSRRTADFRESRVASERSPRLAPRRAARHSRRYVSLETALWRRVASASRCYTLARIFIINSSSYKREMSPFARVGEITRFPSDGSKCRLIAADVIQHGYIQQTKHIDKCSMIHLYYDWFLHLYPTKNYRQKPIVIKNHWMLIDVLCYWMCIYIHRCHLTRPRLGISSHKHWSIKRTIWK